MDNVFIYAWGGGFFTALVVAIAIVGTKQFHGSVTFDKMDGLQKFHTSPTPRIGGVALICGYLATYFFLDGEIRTLWGWIGLAGMPAFLFGFLEDITQRISVRVRLMATTASGLFFALATGYMITHVDVWGFDALLSVSIISLAFTAFAIAGIANAINIIDGFHGLAAGTVIIVLVAFAIVSWRVGDGLLIELSLLMMAMVAGFFLVNFPFGKLFLGDAGAYFLGYSVATVAVMLPARNPEVSPWVSLLVLGYPFTETMISIVRKTRRAGRHPGTADRVHLHMLIYRDIARNLSKKIRSPHLRSAITSVLMWGFSAIILLLVLIGDLTAFTSMASLWAIVFLYIFLYRRVALLRKRP